MNRSKAKPIFIIKLGLFAKMNVMTKREGDQK